MIVESRIVSDALLGKSLAGAPAPLRNMVRNALGLNHLDRLYEQARPLPGENMSGNVLRLLDVHVQITPEDLARIPRTGAVLIVANHPFGLLDGLIVQNLLAEVRHDVRVLGNDL